MKLPEVPVKLLSVKHGLIQCMVSNDALHLAVDSTEIRHWHNLVNIHLRKISNPTNVLFLNDYHNTTV